LSYNYASAQGWEFIICGARDYHVNVNSLRKIEKTTGMILIQIKSTDGIAELWFGRRKEIVLYKNKGDKDLSNRVL
jgi:hypothetical protein